MQFSITKTYQVTTDDGAECGDYADHGIVWDDVVSLRDLIAILREYCYLSATHVDAHTWAESDPELNFRTGDYTTYHLHITAINDREPKAREMVRIYRLAGLV